MTQSDTLLSAPSTVASVPPVKSYRDRDFLLGHIRHTLAFYAPNVLDPSGGFFHFLRDDGTIYNRTTRHLVSSCRYVFNYAMAYRQFGDPQHLDYARHGLKFLRDAQPPYTPAEFDRYIAAWSQPGASTAMINYYRAAVRPPKDDKPQVKTISAPTVSRAASSSSRPRMNRR